MKKPVALSLFIAAIFLSGCATIPTPVHQAYAGDARPESDVSHVIFVGSGFPDIYLYSVDGTPTSSKNESFVPATYSDAGSLGFDVTLLPGEHVLEIYNVHKTPFDKAPLEYLAIGFSTEAGKSYFLARDGSSWKVTADGNAVKTVVKPVGVFAEPSESEPHANLTFTRDTTGQMVYVFRVDGKISASMNYLEPRWVCYNAIDVGELSPQYDSLNLRVPVGHHVVECTDTYKVLLSTFVSQWVRILEFDAQAGKSYRIEVIPNTASGSSPGDEEIKIVAE
jgi:hypothetical protein